MLDSVRVAVIVTSSVWVKYMVNERGCVDHGTKGGETAPEFSRPKELLDDAGELSTWDATEAGLLISSNSSSKSSTSLFWVIEELLAERESESFNETISHDDHRV